MRAPLLAALLFAPVLAHADIPPPGGETCTEAKVVVAGDTCETCSASFRDPKACNTLLGKGFMQRCRTSGASVWNEIWCKAADVNFMAKASDTTQPPPVKPHPKAQPATISANEAPSKPEPIVEKMAENKPSGPKEDAGCLSSIFVPHALAVAALVVRRRRATPAGR